MIVLMNLWLIKTVKRFFLNYYYSFLIVPNYFKAIMDQYGLLIHGLSINCVYFRCFHLIFITFVILYIILLYVIFFLQPIDSFSPRMNEFFIFQLLNSVFLILDVFHFLQFYFIELTLLTTFLQSIFIYFHYFIQTCNLQPAQTYPFRMQLHRF